MVCLFGVYQGRQDRRGDRVVIGYEANGYITCSECYGDGLFRGIIDNPELVREIEVSRGQTCAECGEEFK